MKIFEKETCKKLTIVAVFAAAMAFLETVVVVYLRKLYYPAGFDFPLNLSIEPFILNIEWVREFFTIVMLVCIGLLAGKKLIGKFAYFIYAFAIWDIFYYIWLKVVLNWPSSFLTWDLLFLIPVSWVGPVLAPLIISFTLILLALFIVYFQDKGCKVKVSLKEGLLFVFGCLIVLYTFLYDYSKLIIEGGFLSDFLNLAKNPEFINIVNTYTPSNYNWLLFIIGEALILLSIFIFYFRTKRKNEKKNS